MKKRNVSSLSLGELLDMMRTLNVNPDHPISYEAFAAQLNDYRLRNASEKELNSLRAQKRFKGKKDADLVMVSKETLQRCIDQRSPGKNLNTTTVINVFEQYRDDYFQSNDRCMANYILEQLQTRYNMDITDHHNRLNSGTLSYDELIQELVMTAFSRRKKGSPAEPSEPSSASFSERQALPSTEKEPEIKTYEQLLKAGMSGLDIAKAIVANDLALYRGIPQEHEGDPELWEKYLSSFPQTFRYLVSNGTIVGNWSFIALGEDQLEKVVTGEIIESELKVSESAFLFLPGVYNGYLLNLSVNEGYMTPENYMKLFTAFAEQLYAFAEQRIFFKKFYVNVFREDHEAMYKTFGFKLLCKNVSYGKIYEFSFSPFPDSLARLLPPLRSKYYERFEGYTL